MTKTSISITLARVSGYKLMHPKRDYSYLPSIPELIYTAKKYIKEAVKKSKTIENKLYLNNLS